MRPQCPALLIFAEEDCFDVHAMSIVLENVSNTHVMIYPAKHGFMDLDSMNFHEMQTKSAEKEMLDFMDKNTQFLV